MYKWTFVSKPYLLWLVWASIQIVLSSVQLLSHVRLFATPWIAARQASLPIANSRSPLRFMSIDTCPQILQLPKLDWSQFGKHSLSFTMFHRCSLLNRSWGFNLLLAKLHGEISFLLLSCTTPGAQLWFDPICVWGMFSTPARSKISKRSN